MIRQRVQNDLICAAFAITQHEQLAVPNGGSRAPYLRLAAAFRVAAAIR
jgi:hypothetical protein